MKLKTLVSYLNELLKPNDFNDFAPNGLQIDGTRDIKKLVVGVSANAELINKAIKLNADAILVHHGFFWSREPRTITGIRFKRIAPLLCQNIALIAYHLPLDSHETLGNNVQLIQALGGETVERFGKEPKIGWIGSFAGSAPTEAIVNAIERITSRTPLTFLYGPQKVSKIAVVSGSAASYLEDAVRAGAGMFITGEPSEQSQALAKELNANFVAAGHHATERFGIRALGVHLSARFRLKVHFVDTNNPV